MKKHDRTESPVSLPRDLLRRIKIYAAKNDISMKDAVAKAVEEFLDNKKV